MALWHALIMLVIPQRSSGRAAILASVFNGVRVFGFTQGAWFFLVRGLTPVASTLSVMLIPVLGVFTGALWLREPLPWQDGVAMGLMVLAIVSVLWPQRAPLGARI